MAKLKIEYVPISKVKPWDKNPKKHNMEALNKSMDEFDITQPILVQKKTGLVIAGHGRLEAFKARGMKDIPVIYLDLSDAKAKAYALVDNQTTINEGWDEDILNDILVELKIEIPEMDMTVFGFDEPMDISPDSDDIPEPPENPVTKTGDLYILDDKHRVLCGDSTKPEDMARLMNGKKADMVFTDPPYGIGYEYDNYDDVQGQEYIRFLDGWAKTIITVAPVVIITTGWRYKPYWYALHPADEMVWFDKTKQSGGKSFHMRKTEPIFIFGKVKEKYTWDIIETEGDRGDGMREGHTCPKPVKLIANLIKPQTANESIILDPFGGSGTTLIAASQLNRVCYMMEIDPHYVDVIIERYKQNNPTAKVKIKHNEK